MSDSTKLMASPDEVEETAAAPAAEGDSAPLLGDEEPATAAVGEEPAEEPAIAEETPVADAPAETAGEQEPVVVEAAVEIGATEADAPTPPAEQVAGAPTSDESPAAGDAVTLEAAGNEEQEGAAIAASVLETSEPATAAKAEGEAEQGAEGGDGADGESTGAEPAASGLAALKQARDDRRNVEGRVFGWNPGGFHVVIDGIAAFCPRSEMELEPIADPESYLDKTFAFRILKIQGKGRRIVLSRTPVLREEHDKTTATTLQRLRAGAVVTGKVASLTDFGAFVDVGGVEGLVHVSEISRRRVAKPSDALQVGQEVEVKVLKVERGGRRVSLSMKALEPDPWREVKEKYPEGAIVTGKVERTDRPGAFIELEPGLVGLLPTSEMGLPREAIPDRAYPAGKQVRVQVVSVDPRRQRIGLAPEGSRVEGTRGDYAAYVKTQQREEEAGFKPFAAALQKLKRDE